MTHQKLNVQERHLVKRVFSVQLWPLRSMRNRCIEKMKGISLTIFYKKDNGVEDVFDLARARLKNTNDGL